MEWLWHDAPAQINPLSLLCRLAGWGDTGSSGAPRDGAGVKQNVEQQERCALVSPPPEILAGASQQEGLQACSVKGCFTPTVLPLLWLSACENNCFLACHHRTRGSWSLAICFLQPGTAGTQSGQWSPEVLSS